MNGNQSPLPNVVLPGWAHDLLEAMASGFIAACALFAHWHPMLAALAACPGGPVVKFVKHLVFKKMAFREALHDGVWEMLVWAAGWSLPISVALGGFSRWTLVSWAVWYGLITYLRRYTFLGEWGKQ